MTLRHLGFTLSEFGRKVGAYSSFIVTVLVVLIALIGIAMAR